MGTAEAAKIFERACAGRRRCNAGSVTGAGVDALGGRLSAVAVGQRVCGRTCSNGNDHRGVDGGRVRQSLSNDQTILLSVLVRASRNVDGQRVIGERHRIRDDEVRAQTAVLVQRSAVPVALAFAAMLPGCKTLTRQIHKCLGSDVCSR